MEREEGKMLRRLMAALMALAAAVTLSVAMAAEAAAFSLDGTYAWGMNEAEIQAAIGAVRMDKERGEKLTYLESDDHGFMFAGLRCEITFALSADGLVLIELDLDDGVEPRAVYDALVALYGADTAGADSASLTELEAMSDPDAIDLYDADLLPYAAWTLADGTRILMRTDAEDDEAKVIFYTTGR